MKTFIKALVWILVLGAAGWGFYASYTYVSRQKAGGGSSRAGETGTQKVAVRVTRVRRGSISSDVILTGEVQAEAKVTVFSRLPGPHRLEKLLVDTGKRVKAGERIAVLQQDMLALQLAQARAGVQAAEAALHQVKVKIASLEKDRERLRNLYREKSVPRKSVDDIEAAYEAACKAREAARAALEQARAGFNLAKLQFEESVLHAPIAGIVSRRYMDEGDMVAPGAPVMDIIAMDTVKITAALPETYIPWVSPGKKVEVRLDAYPDKVFTASVSKVHPEVNPRNRTVTIECTVKNPGHMLKPGMFVRTLRIPLRTRENALIVPHAAVLKRDGRAYVFRVDAHGAARETEVHLGISSAASVEITRGISEGDRVVIEGNVGLSDGAPVVVTGEGERNNG